MRSWRPEFVHGRFEHLGCAVDEAGSGPAAIEIIESKQIRPEIMIIDFAMPGLNRIEAVHRIHELVPALPVILVSGFAEAERLRTEGGFRCSRSLLVSKSWRVPSHRSARRART
jgi:CheY-like chemotaxis protein